MNYLITGITGFAGPHLANLLICEKHDVYGLIRASNGTETDILDIMGGDAFQKIKFLYGDLTDRYSIHKLFQDHQFDGVFHLAAQSHPPTSFADPIGTFNTNIMGSAYLIEAIEKYQKDCKFMFCSTSEVYGNIGKDKRKISTSDKILPTNPYGVSKAAIDLYVQERITNNRINGFITRAFSHTGPRRGKNFSISSDAYQIARMKKGLQDKILLVGNLNTSRVVMDVRDTVNAYYLLMKTEKSAGQVFNICGEIPRKMQYFTDKLIELSQIGGIQKKNHSPFYRPFDIYYQHGDTSKIKEITDWKPEIDIETTLSDLLNYWLDKIQC